jgi:glycosyltransferase involved in cell wall biosynthesis
MAKSMSREFSKNIWTAAEPQVSVVVPFFNEAESLSILYQRIVESLDAIGRDFEVIFVNDGSSDNGETVVRDMLLADPRIRLIAFRRNFGKSAALSAGFKAVRGGIVITMDADLQDDPKELPRLIECVEAGADVVSGWKQIRNDPVDKTLPSKLFNATVNKAFGLSLNDHNCGFKAYRGEALKELNLYGELHRFIPALLHARGFKIDQIPVEHHARQFGKSKFGAERLIKGALDLMTVWLTTRYGARPLHMFGGAGIVFGGLGALVLGYLSMLWLFGFGPIGDRPLLMLGMLLVLFGSQLVGVGLLGELVLSRTIGESDKYAVRESDFAAEILVPKPRKGRASSS